MNDVWFKIFDVDILIVSKSVKEIWIQWYKTGLVIYINSNTPLMLDFLFIFSIISIMKNPGLICRIKVNATNIAYYKDFNNENKYIN